MSKRSDYQGAVERLHDMLVHHIEDGDLPESGVWFFYLDIAMGN